ncbi:MAG: hypothetical protein KGD68_10070 [Candidatus Lokiarchaeota archaeon]|nr:hypothetical protein [Candidatus Lokiarchaeota archaeon]
MNVDDACLICFVSRLRSEMISNVVEVCSVVFTTNYYSLEERIEKKI